MKTAIPLGRDQWTLTDWEHQLRGKQPGVPRRFTEAELVGLDAPVRRHLAQAIAPGATLTQCVRLRMRGAIKLGRWLPFRAQQVLNPHRGFVWRARVAGVISGSDHYFDGSGAMNWKLGGVFTVAHGDGIDVTRSAAGRAGVEAILVPTALLPRDGVHWTTQDDSTITAQYQLDGTPIDVRYMLGAAGDIRSLVFDRWGDPDRTGKAGWHPFGGEITATRTFGDLTIPSSGRLGWHFGTDRWPAGEFFRYEITALRPVPAAERRDL